MKRTALTLAVLATLLLAAPAGAQRPELSLVKADQAVQRVIAQEAREWNTELAEILASPEVEPAQDTSSILSYSVTSCDRESRYRALCDYTENWSDGTICTPPAEVIQGHAIYVRTPDMAEEQNCY